MNDLHCNDNAIIELAASELSIIYLIYDIITLIPTSCLFKKVLKSRSYIKDFVKCRISQTEGDTQKCGIRDFFVLMYIAVKLTSVFIFRKKEQELLLKLISNTYETIQE